MDDSGGATVQTENEPDPFSELTAAWRDLQHDTERLNDGMRGELIAAPVIRESLEQKGGYFGRSEISYNVVRSCRTIHKKKIIYSSHQKPSSKSTPPVF